MYFLRRPGLFVSAALFVACTGGQPTTPPSTPVPSSPPIATVVPSTETPSAAPGTATPSTAPSTEPGASLDPSLSDAGIVARVTLTNDTRGGRDGTHDIIGLGSDGSSCSFTFEGDEFIAVAWYTAAPNGQIHSFGITVAAADVPAEDGSTTDIADGGVSFDFKSSSGFGTSYTGATRDNESSATIDVTRAGTSLTFDFDGVTYDGVNFAGQMICADA